MNKRMLLQSTILALGLEGSLQAGNTWTGTTNQDWNTAANWGGALPSTAAITINTATGNTPIISTVVARTGGDTNIGNAASGKLDINSGGSLTTSGKWIFVGQGTGGNGTLNVNSGGTFISDNDIRLAINNSSATSGAGQLNVNGGNLTAARVVSSNVATSKISVSNGGRLTTTSTSAVNGTGNIYRLTTSSFTSGSLVSGAVDIRYAAGNSTISGGSVTAGAQAFVGGSGVTTVLSIDSGSFSSSSWLVVGGDNNSNGTLNLSGTGTINATTGAGSNAFTTIGANNNAVGVVNQSGGTWNQGGIGIVLGEGGTGSGTYNLNGGDLNTLKIWKGTAGGTLNLNGGTLHAKASAVDLIGATVTTNVLSGGAKIDTATFSVTANSTLTGVGGLEKLGDGTLSLTKANTYAGNTTVSGGQLTLADNASLKFVVGAVGVSNKITGNGTLQLDGDFVIDLAGASSTVGDSWTLVDASTLNETYGSTFSVPGWFQPSTGVWQSSTQPYTFTQATGVLTVVNADSDADGLVDAWEIANFGNLTPTSTDDPDGDGFNNLAEATATTNPNSATFTPNDTDGDGLADAWERTYFGSLTPTASDDVDGDFDSNLIEQANGKSPLLASSFSDADSDGMNDGWETVYFGSISAKNGSADTDGDNYTDLQEFQQGTNPTNAAFSPSFVKLAHRWSFNGNLTDTVGGSNATIQNGTTDGSLVATVGADAVTLTGGAKANAQWVKLGSNLLPDRNTPCAIELWATRDAVQNWARIFDFHAGTTETLLMSWNTATTAATDRVQWVDAVTGTSNNTNAYSSSVKYHILMTIEPAVARDSSVVTWYSAPAYDGTTNLELGASRGSFTVANSLAFMNDTIDALGYSPWPDNTASATYDEVRLWDGVIPQWAREALHKQGPDNAAIADSDSDGMPDAYEVSVFGDLSKTASADADNDGSTNIQEMAAGSIPTDRFSSPGDSDADGLPDAWEITYFGNLSETGGGDPDGDLADNSAERIAGSNPALYTSFPDSDSDGMSDPWEESHFGDLSDDGTSDSDGDGFNSRAEFVAKGDPTNPLSPGAVDGDGDNDGLPDRWEVENFTLTSLADVSASADADQDGATNLQEYQATSNPNSSQSTPTDINGDGVQDHVSFIGMDALGSGIVDADGQAIPLTKRLTDSGTAIATQDPGLNLDTAAGTLTMTSDTADINGQGGMSGLEALGISLSSLGFTGTEDLRVRAHFVNLPTLGGFDQIGAYVGTSTSQITRTATIGNTYKALGVNTNGNNDANASWGAENSAGRSGQGLTVIIQRIGGVWSTTCNGVTSTPTAQPTFLDGLSTLDAGVFVLDGGNTPVAHKTATLESLTVVSFGNVDSDHDGLLDTWELTNFSNLNQTGTGDPDSDGFTNEQEETYVTNPNSAADSPDNDHDGLLDQWETAKFASLSQTAAGDPDADGYTNLQEQSASSDPASANSTPVVAYYRFEEGTADTDVPVNYVNAIVDSAGGDDNLNHYGGTSSVLYYRAQAPSVKVPKSGATNGMCTEFDGNDDLYTGILGPLVKGAFGSFTVESYVNFTNLTGVQTFVGRDADLFYLEKANDNHFRVQLKNASGAVVSVEGTASAELGKWYHVAAVGDISTNTLTLYVNGQSVGSSTGYDGLNDPAADSIWFVGRGQTGGSQTGKCKAKIDEVRFTALALAPTNFLGGDTDADGLSDEWEINSFGDLAQTGSGDADSDGFTNEQEETAGTNPASSQDHPVVSDGDSMDDAWEITNFGDTTQTDAGDYDHDGTNNLTEFRLGLNPNNGASTFAVTRSASGQLEWASAPGVTFSVERSTTLGNDWTKIATVPAAASPATTTTFSDGSAPAGKGFYRILLEP